MLRLRFTHTTIYLVTSGRRARDLHASSLALFSIIGITSRPGLARAQVTELQHYLKGPSPPAAGSPRAGSTKPPLPPGVAARRLFPAGSCGQRGWSGRIHAPRGRSLHLPGDSGAEWAAGQGNTPGCSHFHPRRWVWPSPWCAGPQRSGSP